MPNNKVSELDTISNIKESMSQMGTIFDAKHVLIKAKEELKSLSTSKRATSDMYMYTAID